VLSPRAGDGSVNFENRGRAGPHVNAGRHGGVRWAAAIAPPGAITAEEWIVNGRGRRGQADCARDGLDPVDWGRSSTPRWCSSGRARRSRRSIWSGRAGRTSASLDVPRALSFHGPV